MTASNGSRGRRVLGRVLPILVSVVVGVLLLEVGTRVLLPHDGLEPAYPTRVGRFDAHLGWSVTPGTEGVSNLTGRPVRYHINSLGFRGAETSIEKPADTFRIVAIGDSRTFGFGVRESEHFAEILEGYFQRVEVLNLGVAGFGVDQELLRLVRDGFPLEPDLVMTYVPHLGAHRHMYQNRFGEQKPLFALDDGRAIQVRDVPSQDPNRLRRFRRWSGFLSERSKAYRLGRAALAGLMRREKETYRVDDETADGAFMTRSLDLAHALIAEMDRECRERGVSFVLVTEVTGLTERARRDGIPVLDVSAALANPFLAISERLGHLNPAGNGILAAESARYLLATSGIPAAHLRGETKEPPPRSAAGP